MKQIASLIVAFIAAIMPLIFASPASAQATRTWVSGVGDDANPCSRTAACKTFAGAISKTAAGGEINALDPGGFGAVTITKAITIDGGVGNTAGVLTGATNGIDIAAGANDVVTLRNLDINGLGVGLTGVKFTTGAALHIESSTIYGFTQEGVDFAPSTSSSSPIPALFMKNDIIRNNTVGGVIVEPANVQTNVMLNGVSLVHNSGYGLRAAGAGAGGVNIVARDSEISGNTNVGAQVNPASASAVITLQNTTVAQNGMGLTANSVGGFRISNVLLSGNTGHAIDPGTFVASFGNSAIIANGTNDVPSISFSPQ